MDWVHSESLRTRMAFFGFLFAASVIFYHAQIRIGFGFDWKTLAFFAAVATLFRPRDPRLLLGLSVSLVFAVFTELPFTNTNRLFELFIALAIVVSAIISTIS